MLARESAGQTSRWFKTAVPWLTRAPSSLARANRVWPTTYVRFSICPASTWVSSKRSLVRTRPPATAPSPGLHYQLAEAQVVREERLVAMDHVLSVAPSGHVGLRDLCEAPVPPVI